MAQFYQTGNYVMCVKVISVMQELDVNAFIPAEMDHTGR